MKIQLKWLFIIVIATFSTIVEGKVCPELPALDLEQCGHYDFISFGRIDGELDCELGKVIFTPITVFKGEGNQSISLYTSCTDGGIPFSKGEYWVVFGKKNNAQEIQVYFCEHSRQQLPDSIKDYTTEARKTSFQDDLSFLKRNFSKKVTIAQELVPKRYEKISPQKTILLLSIGLVFMLVGFVIIRRWK